MAPYEFNEPLNPDDEARGPDGMLLGPYESYADYLRSEEWRTIREHILVRDGGRCIDCGRPATEVHHRIYPRHIDETELDELVAICRACHSMRARTGTPTSPEENRERVMQMLLGGKNRTD